MGFPRFQALADLRALVAAGGRAPLERIAARIPSLADAAALAEAAAQGCRLPARRGDPHDALALAAALPGEDREGFAVATAFLLADALQARGATPAEDLGWHYEAHAAAYRGLAPPLRAALFNGFRALAAAGAPRLTAPLPADRATRSEAAARRALAGLPQDVASPLAHALSGTLFCAEDLWRRQGRDLRAAPAAADILRHLYETRDGWDPYRDWPDARIEAEGVALPFEAP
jgi:hypothetical protein